jgi:hypothetical protein
MDCRATWLGTAEVICVSWNPAYSSSGVNAILSCD